MEKKIILTKLSDDKFEGNHPNEINEGYTRTGLGVFPVEIGIPFYITGFITSSVTEIIDEFTFKTKNSTYKIEYINGDDIQETE